MHIFEHLYLLLLTGSIVMVTAFDAKIPPFVYGFCISGVSLIALILFWGIGQYESLARAADALQEVPNNPNNLKPNNPNHPNNPNKPNHTNTP